MSDLKDKFRKKAGLPPIVEDNASSFNIKTTGMPHYDSLLSDEEFAEHEGWKAELKWMSPDEYIELSAKGFKGKHGDTTVDDLHSSRNQDKIEKIMQDMESGVKYDTPILVYSDNYFTQEGLHRAMASKNLGHDKIPVWVFTDVYVPEDNIVDFRLMKSRKDLNK